MLTALLHTLWLGFQGFLYYYPLFMSYLWMMGAVLFVWRNERRRDVEAVQRVPDAALPGVSVLVPCFNEGPHAEETIRYALAMDYPEFEVVAINDGSRDDTGAILDAMVAREPRLRVVHMDKNQGKAMALQGGCLVARPQDAHDRRQLLLPVLVKRCPEKFQRGGRKALHDIDVIVRERDQPGQRDERQRVRNHGVQVYLVAVVEGCLS